MPRQMQAKETKEVREEILKEQGGICPLCGTKIELWDAALDHDHDTGRIRGVLHLRCNSLEGTMKSKFKRSGVVIYTDFAHYLGNLSRYLNKDHHMLLHPSNLPGPKKIMKSSYNDLVREIKKTNAYYKKQKRKLIKYPAYPKSKRYTKKLQELFEEFAMEPRFYK